MGRHCSRATPDAKQAQEGLAAVLAGTWGCGRQSPGVSPLRLPALSSQKKSKAHYHIAVIINYLGHCISLAALLVAFVLFLRLR